MERFGVWAQILSSALIVAGLVLVIIELQQSKQLAQAQLASDSMTLWHDAAIALSGEEPAKVLARVCESTGPISLEDALVLSGIYQQYLGRILRTREVDLLAGFHSDRWPRVARGNLTIILAMPGGREFLAQGLPTELESILQTIEDAPGRCEFRGAGSIQQSTNELGRSWGYCRSLRRIGRARFNPLPRETDQSDINSVAIPVRRSDSDEDL